jgi:hypothetical protein
LSRSLQFLTKDHLGHFVSLHSLQVT